MQPGTLPRVDAAEPLWIDEIAVGPAAGRIGMSICPGRKIEKLYGLGPNRDLDRDLDAIRDWGAVAVISLIEHEEFGYYGVPDLRGATLRRGMAHVHLPIVDMDIPDDVFERQWRTEGANLRQWLMSGRQILLHCLAGMGRTGTIAARLLVEIGMTPGRAIEVVRAARPGTIQTLEQEEYVRRLANG